MRTLSRQSLRVLFSVLVIAAASGAALADDYDYSIGSYARAFAMGGAGLAVTRNQTTTERRFNPAALAFTPKGFNLYVPSLSVRADGGVSTSDAIEYLFTHTNSDDAADLIRRFGEQDSVFGVNTQAGFRLGSLEVLFQGAGKARLLPNRSIANWAGSGANLNTIPLDGQADVLAAGYVALPSIAYGIKVPLAKKTDPIDSGYDGSVGLRVRFLQTYYSRYLVNENILSNGLAATQAPEMNGRNYLKDSGVAADLGFLFRPRAGKGINGALVISNLVKPGSTFRASNSGLAQYNGRVSSGEKFELLQTTLSAGAALETGGLTVAMDLMDITSATRPVDFRLGAEQRIGSKVALRGGYSSNTGVTFGVGLFGIDLAFGERLPLEVNKSIRF